jgi:kynureninase
MNRGMSLKDNTTGSVMDDPLLRWREEFPILRETTYLVSNSLGAMPRAAQLCRHVGNARRSGLG